jgi:hypothetical protein
VTSQIYSALPSMGALLGGPHISPDLMGSKLRDSSKDSKEGSSQGELRCLEALGASEENP